MNKLVASVIAVFGLLVVFAGALFAYNFWKTSARLGSVASTCSASSEVTRERAGSEPWAEAFAVCVKAHGQKPVIVAKSNVPGGKMTYSVRILDTTGSEP